jgi:hypothetical protein
MAGVVASGVEARAATVAHYTFSGNSLVSSDTDPTSVAGDMVIGAGLSGNTTFFTIFGSTTCLGATSDHTPATEAAAISGDDYLSFTVTPNAGTALDYSSMTFNFAWQNNSNTVNENLSLRWSVDGFASTLDSQSTSESPGTAGLAGGSFMIPAADQSGPVEFRIYFFDDANTQFSTVGIANVALVATSVPEPSAASLVLLGAAFCGRRWRRMTE